MAWQCMETMCMVYCALMEERETIFREIAAWSVQRAVVVANFEEMGGQSGGQ